MADSSEENMQARFTALYFGYASNLSPETLKQRCPDSLYAGMAVLKDWKFVINSSRYGNLIPSPGDVVYGSLGFLSQRDEDALDESEGVPWFYQKHYLPVTRLRADGTQLNDDCVNALAYVDTQRVEENGTIEPDYVVWINKAIRDGVSAGIPKSYFDKYIRPYAPEDEIGEIMMVRTHQSQVYSPAQQRMYATYNKTRTKNPVITEAMESRSTSET